MRKATGFVFTWVGLSLSLLAGSASGTYQEAGQEFLLGYALADRAADGTVRILLTKEQPELPNRDHHLDRLEALADAAEGGYLMLQPTPAGDGFNITLALEGMDFGSGGQYESEIEFSDRGATGKIHSEVLRDGKLSVSFNAEYLPPRQKQVDLPADGGEPGTILLQQIEAVASGDREAILQTLSAAQKEMFEELTAEEQEEGLSMMVDLVPRNVRITGGALYDGYAIVGFTGEMEGAQATGQGLLVQEGDSWQIMEVSTKFE